MHTALFAAAASAVMVTAAEAGFAGFVAYSRNVGSYTLIDVFAAVTNANDKFLNVYDLQTNGVYVQRNTLATKTWRPDAGQTRGTSDDSFMTAGTGLGGVASGNTAADPNFTGNSWTASPVSAPEDTIPTNAGWYTTDPPSTDNAAELMSAWGGSFNRTDSVLVSSVQQWAAPTSSSSANYGIWCAHLVVTNMNRQIGFNFSFRAGASIKDGVTGATTQATYQFVPAPGAVCVLAAASLASNRRRAA